jgi:lipopolysaccharide/colanic/teichoic acid biosynthesis glycosyltransferase
LTSGVVAEMYKSFFKRFFDLIISLIGFLILSPIFLSVTIFLLIANRGKPFFFQKRPGKDEKIFKIIKFKTMNDKKDSNGDFLPAVKRITPVGAFIRKTSLDEIPQLINVIKGNMSFVGPRPLRVEYLPLYNKEQRLRHNVRPGITGWAQVNGRNNISWAKRFEMDVYYVNNLNLILDIKIFFLTLKKTFFRVNINQDDNNTMIPFGGIKLNS